MIEKVVYGFKTKYKQGFTDHEVSELLKKFPDLNMDKFNEALIGITCLAIDGEIITYHRDIETAIRCGVENRDIKLSEFD